LDGLVCALAEEVVTHDWVSDVSAVDAQLIRATCNWFELDQSCLAQPLLDP
jgi:hypothetical protein